MINEKDKNDDSYISDYYTRQPDASEPYIQRSHVFSEYF
jgi:hypothetical protein